MRSARAVVRSGPGSTLSGELRDGEGVVGGVEEERPDEEQHRRYPGD